jgi:hypothetical protein
MKENASKAPYCGGIVSKPPRLDEFRQMLKHLAC